MLLAVVVHAANIQDRDGAKFVLKKLRWRFPRLRTIFADGGYSGKLATWVRRLGGWTLEIVRRNAAPRGFVVLPKRWIVERTFAWLNRSRRLSKDYEERTDTHEALIHIAMIQLMLKRVKPNE
jgi:putative transposase